MTKLNKMANSAKQGSINTIKSTLKIVKAIIKYSIIFRIFIAVPLMNLMGFAIDFPAYLVASDKANFEWIALDKIQYAMGPVSRFFTKIFGVFGRFLISPFTLANYLKQSSQSGFGSIIWLLTLVFGYVVVVKVLKWAIPQILGIYLYAKEVVSQKIENFINKISVKLANLFGREASK